MHCEDVDVAAALNNSEYVVKTQESVERMSFGGKMNLREDSRNLRISEHTFMRMIQPADFD